MIADHRAARADERGHADRDRGAERAGGQDGGDAGDDRAGARRGQRAGERDAARRRRAASVTARIGSTTAHAPATRDANSAMRERPVAARSRKTPDSMSCVPAVAPMIAPMTSAISDHDLDVRRGSCPAPPAGPYLHGVAAVLDGHHDERQRASGRAVSSSADGEHAAPAAQLEHVGSDESEVEHQDRSSRRVVMVRKRSSSEVRDGRDALDGDAVVEQPAQQRGDDLAIDRRLGAERHAQRRRRDRTRASRRARRRAAAPPRRGCGRRCRSRAGRRARARGSCPGRRPCPWSTIAARSQVFSTSSSRCEDSSTVRPSPTSSRIRWRISRMPAGIEPVHRLVEDQQLGVGQQAARDAEALAHARASRS